MIDRNALANQAEREWQVTGTAEADRVAAVRRMLLGLRLDSDDPRWSSDILDRLIADVVEASDGSVGDLFHALFGVLGDYSTKLSKPVAGLIKDLVVNCFTRHRQSYSLVDWKAIAGRLGGSATAAQLYLALHAIPPEFVPATLAHAISEGLSGTSFQGEAASALAV